MQIKFSELKKKKVVNVLDGKFLGYVFDVNFDFPECKITSFICGDKKSVFCREEYVICPCDVNKIGDDTVLVCLKDRNSSDCRRRRTDEED